MVVNNPFYRCSFNKVDPSAVTLVLGSDCVIECELSEITEIDTFRQPRGVIKYSSFVSGITDSVEAVFNTDGDIWGNVGEVDRVVEKPFNDGQRYSVDRKGLHDGVLGFGVLAIKYNLSGCQTHLF